MEQTGTIENSSLLMVIPWDSESDSGSERLDLVLKFVETVEVMPRNIRLHRVHTAEEFQSFLQEQKPASDPKSLRPVLFAVRLGNDGVNIEYARILRLLRREPHLLEGYIGGVITDADSELYTKSTATELVLAANQSGCAFVGKPLVEGTGSLDNFRVAAKNLGTADYLEAYRVSARKLLRSILDFRGYAVPEPSLLCLHASSHKTSNTFSLWRDVRDRLTHTTCSEIGLRNGTLYDCSGCPYQMCLHYGEKDSCFYGGVMVENVYPAIRESNAILMVCPNYNDALSANLTGFINRLTALYRKRQFYDKALFAIIVSGYSGGDNIARQLIAALNMNKNFYLPAHFCIMETANDPGTAEKLPGIRNRVEEFAARIEKTLVSESRHSNSG
ncbi:NAD(P)H-dependent oxidoreductase [[Clostridium] aminophilum]|uniref:NAD(P)H-dependent oxidoreductase n=1 Tax=[Clostridium] aminophilum TaxID=1526 RepID=UPI0026EAC4CF|nr:NAD(P)H-dependent oxidoreductase [[Clostridium] aminophilum]MDD6196115.1 NAD(P)H-dependent oxidoreductase [[Clostridium] aminophilum]